MTSFALITEGITDQAVLEIILQEIYSKALGGDLDVVSLQPLRDTTDEARAGNDGGWERVLEHCSYAERLREALSINDYLVVQIDTDCGEHVNFGVSLTQEGRDRSVGDIVEDVKSLIITKIGADLYQEIASRLVFAISVHSIECWILSLFVQNRKGRTKNCESHLVNSIRRNGGTLFKEYRSYRDAATGFNKMQNIISACKTDRSLEIFVKSLPSI